MIVDRDVEELISSPGRFELAISMHPMPRPPEARQPLDIEMHQVTGVLVLIALHGWLRIQDLEPVQPYSSQLARHGA